LTLELLLELIFHKVVQRHSIKVWWRDLWTPPDCA